MMNKPWECPRCGRINAPFNPTCFCKKDDKSVIEKITNDAYTMQYTPPSWAGKPIPCDIPKNHQCLICNGYHGNRVSCVLLKVE